MDWLLVNPKYAQAWNKHGWRTVDSVIAHFLPDSRPAQVTVHQTMLVADDGAISVFFKLYDHRSSDWGFWMRASKARREFENYATFARLEVSAAEAIACGEERDRLGRLRRAFIVTRAVPDALSLVEFFKAKPPWPERRAVLAELAGMVRHLHAASFFCYDLVWRNILVSRNCAVKPRVFLIDCPRGRHSVSGLRRRQLRDLASLDKSGAQFCSRAERLRFLLQYAGQNRIGDEMRTLARDCLDYRRTRWPEDWRGK